MELRRDSFNASKYSKTIDQEHFRIYRIEQGTMLTPHPLGEEIKRRSLCDQTCHLHQGHSHQILVTMVSTPLKSTTRYIRLSIIPGRGFDELSLRKTLQDSLTQSFGTSYALTHIDILSLQDIAGEDRKDAVIRVAENEAGIVMAAAATATSEPRLSVVDDAPFLPVLIAA